MLLELYQEHVKQLLRKTIKEERHFLEMEKRYRKVYGKMNYSHQKCSLYQDMVKDLGKESKRTIFSGQKQILFYEKSSRKVGGNPVV